jgi:hypothetical protein
MLMRESAIRSVNKKTKKTLHLYFLLLYFFKPTWNHPSLFLFLSGKNLTIRIRG